MTKRWMMGAAAAALTVATVVAAQAADLPTRKGPPAPVYVPPPFTWTGFYVGLNAGGAWATGNTTVNAFFPTSSIYYANYNNNSLGTGASGFIGGGQAGYNYQSGAAVFGIETDFDGSSMSKSKTIIGTSFTNPGFGPDYFTTNASARLNWLGTTRARIGFVATPDNRLMFYGTGGVAYGGGNAHCQRLRLQQPGRVLRLEQPDPGRLDGRRRRRIRDHQQHHDQGRIPLLQPGQQHQYDLATVVLPLSPVGLGLPRRRTTKVRSSAPASTTSSDRSDLI